MYKKKNELFNKSQKYSGRDQLSGTCKTNQKKKKHQKTHKKPKTKDLRFNDNLIHRAKNYL